MSRNGSGTYTLPAGNPVVTGTTIASTWANNTMNDLASALTDSVAADGQTSMTGNLNLNSNKIVNLATPTLSTDAVTKAYADALVSGAGSFTSLTVTGTTTLATSLTGVLKGTSGVVSTATAGTDYVAPSGALGTPSSGTLTNCTVDGTNLVGYRNVPQSGSDKTTSYTLTTGDVGEFVGVGSGGSVTIPNSTFATGDIVSIFNNTSGNITITCTITTAYIAGTNTDVASVTLATRGVATLLFISGTVVTITGNVA